MRKYELTIILGTEENETSTGKEQVEALLLKSEAATTKNDDLGIRDLAYAIRKRRKGHYYYYEFDAEPQNVFKLEEELKLTNPLLKHLLIRKEQ
jgi:small subunit ribosomal protein S6